MVNILSVSSVAGKDVFSTKGSYIGKVEDVECDLKRFKLRSLVIKAVKGSYMSRMLGEKRGVIIPYSMIEAIGDVIVVKHVNLPEADDKVPGPAAASGDKIETTDMASSSVDF